MNAFIRYAALGLVVLGLAACKKDPPPAPPPPTAAAEPAESTATDPATAAAAAASTVAFSNATLGSAIGADKKITTATETFAKSDRIYIAVETSGAGPASVKVKWTYYEKDKSATVITEQNQGIAPEGAAVTEFNMGKPDGWPVGDYQVEVFVNDQPVQTKKFAVK